MVFEFDKTGFVERLLGSTLGRDEKNITLAFECNLPLGTFEGYIYARNTPTAGKLAQLCAGLGISADWLLFGISQDAGQQNTGQNDGFSLYRFMQSGLPIAEFSGKTNRVLKDVNDYIAAYEADVPLVVEIHLDNRWVRLAWIGVNRSGVRNAG